MSTLKGCETIFFGIKALFNLHLDWVVVQVDIENDFNNIFWTIIVRVLQDVRGLLANIVPFNMMFYGVH